MNETPALSDRDLTEAVLAGAPGAFERLVREHQTLCWHIALKLTRDPEDARDLCQEIFLRVHRYLHQYRYDSALKTWIGRIAYSCALRHLERRRTTSALALDGEAAETEIEVVPGPDDVHESASRAQLDTLVRTQMRRLPPVQSLLLTLYHLDELSLAEIAAMTGMPMGTIKSHLARARARLRDHLAITLGERP